MADMEDVIRRNPEAAAELASMRDALEMLAKLRDAGIAKGDQTRPLNRKSGLALGRPILRFGKHSK